MYILLLAVLVSVALGLVRSGRHRRSPGRVRAGFSLLVATVLFFSLLSFWGEMLWFDALGQGDRFWTMVWARAGTFVVATGLGAIGVRLLTWQVDIGWRSLRRAPVWIGGAGGAFLGLVSWQEVLLHLNRVSVGRSEPVLGRDIGFYLFQLPLYDHLLWLGLWIVCVSLTAALTSSFSRQGGKIQLRRWRTDGVPPARPIMIVSASLALVLAVGAGLGACHLLYAQGGVVRGAGWTDVHVRLPAYGLVGLITLLLGAAPLVPALRKRWRRWLHEFGSPPPPSASEGPLRLVVASEAKRWIERMEGWLRAQAASGDPALLGLGAAWLGIAATAFFALLLVPRAVQWLVVEPNEITFEKPYIERNIAFTRHAFGLDRVESRQFPASDRFTEEMVRDSAHLLSEVRLWDSRALDAVYKQFQEIRLYYEFYDVDMDRYRLGDRYRQVMVSARELTLANLPEKSRTFVNERLKYTHGYGLTLSTVSDFTEEGLPNLLVKDIPPRSEFPELVVDRPQIYYGELTKYPAVVNTREAEFDHPSGDRNVYIRYPGTGGVLLSSFWRRFVYGWKFDGTPFLFSSYPTKASRILFHRQVRDRIARLAPFLHFDSDPYIVLVEGRLYWIIDAYTTSRYYPYSEPFSSAEVISYQEEGRTRWLRNRVVPHLHGANYVRNSVKAVVDAFDGNVDFYVFDPDDPVIQVWQRAFPGLFDDAAQMPAGLRAHVRYPESFLLAQGLVYAKYHMSDPMVFYNQEDLWVRATEKYYADIRPVEPYYVMWELPGSDTAEFASVLPFTPKHRQVLIGWIAGLCDGDNYGRLLAYKFPKERRVLGPQQVETKIDQDRYLSAQLTLWDQRGSSVIRGNVLAIPIEDTLLYVEPIYLQADTAAYPELRVVVTMHGDTMTYADTFEEALLRLIEGGTRRVELQAPSQESDVRELARRANRAFESYLRLQGERRFEEAGRELESLRGLLQTLSHEDENGRSPAVLEALSISRAN